ncbi:hypothetical protein [Paraburkholderia sp. J10-1]|uniref:hypothetical protein n=1 Tax=Paraburkholderia sp. J10-1 TaxID=2805430 RepID=UPI002AB656E2|nr:hypothetical protein [Paraburkholderia sp. J10-1]
MNGTSQKYTLQDQNSLENYVNRAMAAQPKPGLILDSAATAKDLLDSAKNEAGAEVPKVLNELLGKAPEAQESALIKAVLDGATVHSREHGFLPHGDLLLSALHQCRSVYDSATNSHHDQISLTTNAPVIAILSALSEATPFAGYLPVDQGSNEARLIVVAHQAASDWGDYSRGDLMDGVKSGGVYLGAPRTLELSAPNSGKDYKFAFLAQTEAGDAIILLRGRTIIYVNGLMAAMEVANAPSTSAQVNIGGIVRLDGQDYALAGTVKPDTGEIVVTPTPALPNGSIVTVEAFVDYEADDTKTPKMAVQASAFSLFAAPFRAVYQVTPEARSQFANEVGVDAGAEAMLAVRAQFAMERHYNALKKVRMIGRFANKSEFDYDYQDQIKMKSQSQIWQNFSSHVGAVSQQMAEDTADHGVTHLYVGKNVGTQFQAMPGELFEPSGITARPSIYRLGKLFGQYEVYYNPQANETADGTASEIVAVGRSSQTARCPIIFGDAQAPFFEPLGTTEQLKSGYGFSSRCFTHVNPHQMSAVGCAVINVKNLK